MQTNKVFEIGETIHVDITFLKKSIILIVEAMTVWNNDENRHNYVIKYMA